MYVLEVTCLINREHNTTPAPPHICIPLTPHIYIPPPPASATFHLFFLSLLATRSKMKRQPDKRKQRNHSSIGCEYKNFLLADASFSGSFCSRNYILIHMFRDKTIFFLSFSCHCRLSLLRTLNLPRGCLELRESTAV